MSRTVHVFSVDVEEHFQVSAFERIAPRETWETHPSRVVANTRRLLDLLDAHEARATFFVLGWVAERQPALVREIAARGHEVASHGYWHRRVNTQTPAEFREDVRRSKTLLESLVGQPVLGYRAPSFSILPGMMWAFDVLLEEGFRYDSSRFPIVRPGYGWPGAPVTPHFIQRPSGELLELPLATSSFLGQRLPGAGGAYLRLLPLGLVTRAVREQARRGSVAMLYIHPWEYDPDQPRLDVSWLTRIRHYGGLRRTWGRLERLLRDFSFTSVEDAFTLRSGRSLSLPAL